MRVNIIRPGYTFGNPVMEDAPTQSDTRFEDIVKGALKNKAINVVNNDGTQFIWAGDLAKLYINTLHGTNNRKTYFGLSKKFVSWYNITKEVVKRSESKSKIILEDKGYDEKGINWDVSLIKKDFNLEFDPWVKIIEHIDYRINIHK